MGIIFCECIGDLDVNFFIVWEIYFFLVEVVECGLIIVNVQDLYEMGVI